MRKTRHFLLIISLLLSFSAPVLALDLGKAALFSTGWIAGIYCHELGHSTVALIQGATVKSINFSSTDVRYGDMSPQELDEKIKWLSMGGYLAQSIASEVILQNKNWHENDFALGMMWMGINNNLNNVIAYYVFHATNNDLGVYATRGGDPLVPAILMAGWSSFVLYRIFTDTKIIPYLSNRVLGITIPF